MEVPSQAPVFSLDGETFVAKVVDVYDGDTFKCIFKFRGTYDKWTCRIIGINAPEIRTKNLQEKEKGYIARDKLREFILDKDVTLKCSKFGKYGRLLVKVEHDDIDIGDKLIELGLVVPYML